MEGSTHKEAAKGELMREPGSTFLWHLPKYVSARNLYRVMTHLLACESDLLYYYMYMYCIKSCWRPQQRAHGRIFDFSHGYRGRFKHMLLLLRGCWVLRRKPKNLKGTHPNTDTGRTRRRQAERPGIKPSGVTVPTAAPPCRPARFSR